MSRYEKRALNFAIEAFSTFFDRVRSGCEHSASLISVNLQTNVAARYDRTVVIWKGVLKTVSHNTVFYLMESRVSNKCTRNIYRPFTPEKEVNRKENTLGKIAKRRQTATDSKVYAYVDIELGEVLFRFVIFCDKENRNLARFIAFPSAEFPKIYWTVKHIYALPSVCW